MSKVSSAKHPRTTTNRKTNAKGKVTEQDFLRRLGDLADRWTRHDRDDLALRHATGQLLNRYFGKPTQRQAWGAGTMKKAAEQLRRTEVELSQLRRFAFRFQTLKVFKRKHPKVTTWTKVRKLLAAPRKPDGGKNGEARKKSTGMHLRKLIDGLAVLTSALGKMKIKPKSPEAQQLRAKLQAFVKAVPDCLRSYLVVQTKSDRKAA
jgi:hypothetical protein